MSDEHDVTAADVHHALKKHEEKSEERYEHLKSAIKHGHKHRAEKGEDMNTDHVTVNTNSEGQGGLGGMGMALAGLASRGMGGTNGLVSGGVGLLAGLALGGRRGGGIFGGGDCDNGGGNVVANYEVMNKLGYIQQEIAQVGAAGVQAITSLTYQGAISNCQNFGDLKMQIATGNLQVIANSDQNTFKILGAISQNEITNLTTKTIEQNARIVALETGKMYEGHNSALREQITITNNNSASAAAVAVARQDADWRARLECRIDHNTTQVATAANVMVQGAGSFNVGAQNANPTNVNTR